MISDRLVFAAHKLVLRGLLIVNKPAMVYFTEIEPKWTTRTVKMCLKNTNSIVALMDVNPVMFGSYL